MLWCYDNAICEDLSSCLNPDTSNPNVRVISPEGILGLLSQIQDDTISYPAIALERSDDIAIDTDRHNFSRLHFGVHSVFDAEHNLWYNEKVMPINLSYTLNILGTNTVDVDELCRELIFRYSDMYFLKFRAPYEGDREIRFGVRLDPTSTIQRESSTKDYLSAGQLYRYKLNLICDGCVLLTYTPVKLKRHTHEIQVD